MTTYTHKTTGVKATVTGKSPNSVILKLTETGEEREISTLDFNRWWTVQESDEEQLDDDPGEEPEDGDVSLDDFLCADNDSDEEQADEEQLDEESEPDDVSLDDFLCADNGSEDE
jgi:hypothetical protein